MRFPFSWKFIPAGLVPLALAAAIAFNLAMANAADPECYRDSFSYMHFDFSSWASMLSQHRTIGYPLFLRFFESLFGGYRWVPETQAAILCIASLILYRGLRLNGYGAVTSLAGVLPSLVMLYPQHALLMSDGLGYSLMLLTVGIVLHLHAHRQALWLYLLYAAVLFITYQVRPVYLHGILSIPAAIGVYCIFRNGITISLHTAKWWLAVTAASVAPFFMFCLFRFLMVGSFGLVSFSGVCFSGFAGEILREESIPKLPPEQRMLARLTLNERQKWKHVGEITDTRTYPRENGISHQHPVDPEGLPGYNLVTWRVLLPLSRYVEDSYIAQDRRLKAFSRDVFLAESGLLRRWWMAVAKWLLRHESIFLLIEAAALYAFLIYGTFVVSRGRAIRPATHTNVRMILAGTSLFVTLALAQMAVSFMMQPILPRYLLPVDGFLFLAIGMLFVFIEPTICTTQGDEDTHTTPPPATEAPICLQRYRSTLWGVGVCGAVLVAYLGLSLLREKYAPRQINAKRLAAQLNEQRSVPADLAPPFGISPLHLAALESDSALAAELLRQGQDPLARDRDGFTPMHYAAAAGAETCVALLLQHGAPADAKAGDTGLTPLHLARHAAVAALLLDNGADPNAADRFGGTPLHWAADAQTAALLLARGADATARFELHNLPLPGAQNLPRTPLIHAFFRNDAEMVRLLWPHSLPLTNFEAKRTPKYEQYLRHIQHEKTVGATGQ